MGCTHEERQQSRWENKLEERVRTLEKQVARLEREMDRREKEHKSLMRYAFETRAIAKGERDAGGT